VSPTTVTDDVALLAVVLGLAALALLVVHVARESVRALSPRLPQLPDDDCAPAGLGRLVPAGVQVEQESRRGVLALELWLVAHRRHSGAPASDSAVSARLLRQRDAGRVDEGTAREAG
jgi:hypothetical protein